MKEKRKPLKSVAFLGLLATVASLYNWSTQNGEIVGKPKNKRRKPKTVDPLSAVANEQRRRKHRRLVSHPVQAVQDLQLAPDAETNITKAVRGKGSRGYHQVLRGRIKRVLGLS